MKVIIKVELPILNGSISTAKSRCGKRDCSCQENPKKLHGIYYRWTGILDGKRTTKTISREVARECEKRINRYKKIKRRIDLLLKSALSNAPWIS